MKLRLVIDSVILGFLLSATALLLGRGLVVFFIIVLPMSLAIGIYKHEMSGIQLPTSRAWGMIRKIAYLILDILFFWSLAVIFLMLLAVSIGLYKLQL
jgi:uncharacterized membrane protein